LDIFRFNAWNGVCEYRIFSIYKLKMYNRVLLKVSGELFQNSDGSAFDFAKYDEVAKYICDFVLQTGVDLAVVVGAGNLWRYRDTAGAGLDRVDADKLGMVATTFNAKLLENAILKYNLEAVAVSDFPVPDLLPSYDVHYARVILEQNSVLILAGGTGNPYFTTDSCAVLRALELGCDLLIKATKVDGVYDSDPKKNPGAKKYAELKFSEVLAQNLEVMDLPAISLAKDNNLPIFVFDFTNPANLIEAYNDFSKGTLVTN
jgi:uridylate kinase